MGQAAGGGGGASHTRAVLGRPPPARRGGAPRALPGTPGWRERPPPLQRMLGGNGCSEALGRQPGPVVSPALRSSIPPTPQILHTHTQLLDGRAGEGVWKGPSSQTRPSAQAGIQKPPSASDGAFLENNPLGLRIDFAFPCSCVWGGRVLKSVDLSPIECVCGSQACAPPHKQSTSCPLVSLY